MTLVEVADFLKDNKEFGSKAQETINKYYSSKEQLSYPNYISRTIRTTDYSPDGTIVKEEITNIYSKKSTPSFKG